MRKLRKGFTLLELLVVIAVMSVLGSMAMISGQEAMDVANASNIISGFESVSAAMMMYYADASSGDIGAANVTEANIVEGVQAYVKNKASVVAQGTGEGANKAVGVYAISLVGENAPKSWWLTYTLPAADTRIGKILETKAKRLGLSSDATDANIGKYAAEATVCMKVR